MKTKLFSLMALSLFTAGSVFASVSVYDNADLVDAAIEADLQENTHHTTIIDTRNGNASGVTVEGALIHVYTYGGASSEANTSTFAAGEDWSNWMPKPKAMTSTTRAASGNTFSTYYRTNPSVFNLNYVSPYVMMVDECIKNGGSFDHAKVMCINR